MLLSNIVDDSFNPSLDSTPSNSMRTFTIQIIMREGKILGLLPIKSAHKCSIRIGSEDLIFDFRSMQVLWPSKTHQEIAVIRESNKGSLWRFLGEFQTADGHTVAKRRTWLFPACYEILGERIDYDLTIRNEHFGFNSHEDRISATMTIKTENAWRSVIVLAAIWLFDVYEFSSQQTT